MCSFLPSLSVVFGHVPASTEQYQRCSAGTFASPAMEHWQAAHSSFMSLLISFTVKLPIALVAHVRIIRLLVQQACMALIFGLEVQGRRRVPLNYMK